MTEFKMKMRYLSVMISGIHSNSGPEEKWHCTTARNLQRKAISNNMTYAHNILELSFPTKLCNHLRVANLESTLFSKHGLAHLHVTVNKGAFAKSDMWGTRGQVTSKLTSV